VYHLNSVPLVIRRINMIQISKVMDSIDE